MKPFSIKSSRLELIAANPELLKAASQSDQHLANLLQVDFAEQWNTFGKEIFSYVLEQLKDKKQYTWLNYFIIHLQDQCLIGTCGYKGAPKENQQVEIGYEIAEKYQGKGYATEAASALINRAFEFENIGLVKAHTLNQENASIRVLTKCSFEKSGELVDPEDGIIWSWELPKKRWRKYH